MIKNQPLISVIVPVYNGAKFLNRCLGALFASDYSAFEVIVVDDGSTDDSSAICREKGAVVLSMPRQSGPSAARNFGVKEAKGEILLFVDADVVVKSDTIAKVAASFELHPEISALFGSYDDEPGEKNFLSQYKNLQHHFVHQNSNSEAATFWAGLGAIREKYPKVRMHSDLKGTPPEHRNRRNDFIMLGSLRISNRETPGHSEDGVTYVIGNFPEDGPFAAIVGDAIFAGSMGRGNQSWDLAKQKVRESIFNLPTETLLCPGHGPLTTIAQEKAHNPFF